VTSEHPAGVADVVVPACQLALLPEHTCCARSFRLHSLLLLALCIILRFFVYRWPLSRQCEIPRRFAALFCITRHVKCYSYHAHTSTKYLYAHKYAAYSEQFQATFPWQDFFPDISLTAVKFPDISRFSRQVVTLCVMVHELYLSSFSARFYLECPHWRVTED